MMECLLIWNCKIIIITIKGYSNNNYIKIHSNFKIASYKQRNIYLYKQIGVVQALIWVEVIKILCNRIQDNNRTTIHERIQKTFKIKNVCLLLKLKKRVKS